MEYRKELSEKSKKLIAKQFKSDILNRSTGYYKTENILPITSKPNEKKINLKKFVPHFQEIKAAERHFNNLLSDKQRNNSFILKHKNFLPNKNQELEIIRKRAKTIKDNCYDKKGNFSSKRRYILEFYGLEKLNNSCDFSDKYNKININNIKDDNEISIVDNKDGDKEKEIENYRANNKFNGKINRLKKNENKIRKLLLKSRNNNMEICKEENYFVKPTYEERFNTISNNYIDDKNNSFYNDINEKLYNKINRKKIHLNNPYNESSFTNERMIHNTISNIINPIKVHNRIRTDIHLPGMYNNITKINTTVKAKNFNHPNDITKLFYTKSNNPVRNMRIKKNEINKDDKDYFTLEFQFQNNNDLKELDLSSMDKLSQKNIKEIFYNNGLHIYNINEDKMNNLFTNKKLEAKLRKEKNNKNFDNNYKNVINALEKKGIKVDKIQISNRNGYQNKKIVKKKRKGTPGTILYDNRFNKDENTKINTGKNNCFNRKSKNIVPQYDRNYKNFYKYKEKKSSNKKI